MYKTYPSRSPPVADPRTKPVPRETRAGIISPIVVLVFSAIDGKARPNTDMSKP